MKSIKPLILSTALIVASILLQVTTNTFAYSDTITVCTTDDSSERECDYQTLQDAVNHIHNNSGVNKIRILSSLPAENTATTIPNSYPGRSISFICNSKANVIHGTSDTDMISGGSLLASYRFEGCTFDTANRIIYLQGRQFTLKNNNFYNGRVAVGASTQTHTIEANMFSNAELAPLYGGQFNIYNNVFRDGVKGISINSGGQFRVWHNTFDSLTHGIYVNHSGTSVKNSIVSNTYSFITQNTGSINSSNTLAHDIVYFRQGNMGGTDVNVFKGDPLYTDSELRISQFSPAVGQGLVTEVLLDKDGNRRDSNPDLGAYEAVFPFVGSDRGVK